MCCNCFSFTCVFDWAFAFTLLWCEMVEASSGVGKGRIIVTKRIPIMVRFQCGSQIIRCKDPRVFTYLIRSLMVCADISEGLWSNGVPQNEEDISYMFDDEATPVKACGDLPYHIDHGGIFFFFPISLSKCALISSLFLCNLWTMLSNTGLLTWESGFQIIRARELKNVGSPFYKLKGAGCYSFPMKTWILPFALKRCLPS